MTDDFTEETIEQNRPTYRDGTKTHLSTAEFLAQRTVQLGIGVLLSPMILIMIFIALVVGGVPSYTEAKNDLKQGVITFATDRSPPQHQCAHEWEFVSGIRGHSEGMGLRADGLHYRVYDSLKYECQHCGRLEWVHINESFRTIEPSTESTFDYSENHN